MKHSIGLARPTIECQSGVDWNADIVARETGLKQRKAFEGIESLQQRHHGIRVLNNFDHVETWKPILNYFFDRAKDCGRPWIITKSKSTRQASVSPRILTTGNFLNILKRTSKTGRNVGFKEILPSENPQNNSKSFKMSLLANRRAYIGVLIIGGRF